MAEIPSSIDLAPVQGQMPSTDAVRPTDFGLERAGQEAAGVADMAFRARLQQERAQAVADRKAVEPDVLAFQAANADQFAADRAAWNGQTPGFALDQIGKARSRAQDMATNPNYTPGQRSEFTQLTQAATTNFGQAAIDHERQVLTQSAVDQQEVQVNGALAGFYQSFAPAKQQLHDNYDGSQPGLTQNTIAAFDTAAQGAIQAAPEAMRPRLQVKLASMRVEELAQAATTEQHGQDSYVLNNTTAQADALVNTVTSNPLAYDGVVRDGLPALVAALPAGLDKKNALREFTGLAAQARVEGLIRQDKAGQAVSELNDGRYDAVLDPKVKEGLEARASAANEASGPSAVTRALQADQLQNAMNADLVAARTTGRSTGSVDLDAAAKIVGAPFVARYQENLKGAFQAYAAAGAVRDKPTADVQALAHTPMPDPSDPAYADKLAQWSTETQVAQEELKARSQPGAYIWATNTKGAPTRGAGAAAISNDQDRGAMAQGQWQAYQAAAPADKAAAGATYANTMLGAQAHLGIPASARQILPQDQVSAMAAGVINAAPEQKLNAIQALASTLNGLPASVALADGSTAAPRQILAQQLLAAHMSPMEVSALADYGADPAKLGRFVAALNDPTLKKPLDKADSQNLTAGVKSALQPYLNSALPMPGNEALAQARQDRTILIARELMASQGLSAAKAAQVAAGDMTAGYKYVDTWRMPNAAVQAESYAVGPITTQDGASVVRGGAARLLTTLTANKGSNLYAPATLDPNPDLARQKYATAISNSGRWVTRPDDSGLTLMLPHGDGTWDQVADRYGRPVGGSWAQLAQPHFNPLAQAPPTQVHAPGAAPLPAVTKGQAFSALSGAVTDRESHGVNGLVSAKGALGPMQVTPQTVQTYAPRLGLPVDLGRAQNDPAYNQKIGEAALMDMVNRYGANSGGIGLDLAAYNAGPGALEGYTDKAGAYHPGWLHTIGDPRKGQIGLTDFVNRIPWRETRDYVQAVLPGAVRRIQGTH